MGYSSKYTQAVNVECEAMAMAEALGNAVKAKGSSAVAALLHDAEEAALRTCKAARAAGMKAVAHKAHTALRRMACAEDGASSVTDHNAVEDAYGFAAMALGMATLAVRAALDEEGGADAD